MSGKVKGRKEEKDIDCSCYAKQRTGEECPPIKNVTHPLRYYELHAKGDEGVGGVRQGELLPALLVAQHAVRYDLNEDELSQAGPPPEDVFFTPEEDTRQLSPPPSREDRRCRRQLVLQHNDDDDRPSQTKLSNSQQDLRISAARIDSQNSKISANVSLEGLVQCSQCSQPRFFKGNRGLKIHMSKSHRSLQISDEAQIQNENNESFGKFLGILKSKFPVLKRIPRGARVSVAKCLVEDIKKVNKNNTREAWEHLLTFPYRILHVSKNPLDRNSLTYKIKQNCIQNSNSYPDIFVNTSAQNSFQPTCSSPCYRLVEEKLGDGDIRGSARLLFSNDSLAPNNQETLLALKNKHPPAAANPTLPLPVNIIEEDSLTVTLEDVTYALASFPSGSAGGLDSLTPQHLKDLTSASCGEIGDCLLKELILLVNLMLTGKVNEHIINILYGANLCALLKKDGGIRPIAVGTVYRRLTAKICVKHIKHSLAQEFQPLQLGFGTHGGCEAAVHALRTFLNHQGGEVLLKVDVKNAFNTIDRKTFLNEIKDKIPFIYNFIWQCYGTPSKLMYKSNELWSETGCQQGDPLGPAIFSLAIHPIIKKLESKFNVWYLDDGTLGGDVSTVLKDLQNLTTEFHSIGLSLNFSKCELYISNSSTTPKIEIANLFEQISPGIKFLENRTLRLLGAPILDESIQDFVDEKIQNFKTVSDRLQKINIHMAYFIIRYCLFVPKFMYSLRCCQLWNNPLALQQLDNIQRDTLTTIFNTVFDDRTWRQVSLPVRFGGLGVRKISSVSLPAFLSSVFSTQDLVKDILTPSLQNFKISGLTEALEGWKAACPSQSIPKAPNSQRQWDEPLCKLECQYLVDSSTSSTERARLLAVSRWESGLWLHALPSKNIGNLLDDNTFRVAISLRIGALCQVPHRCSCGETADRLGHHALSCSKSAGRISRHASLNDIIRRAFVSAGVPAVLEPNGLMRDDGKRPDGMTLIPWKMGRPLVWDATCVDTLAPSHLSVTSGQAGAAASKAENLKGHKYSYLDRMYLFVPFGVETLGPWGPAAHDLYRDLAKRLKEASGDQNAGIYFGQKLSIAIQRGNAASILATYPSSDGLFI